MTEIQIQNIDEFDWKKEDILKWVSKERKEKAAKLKKDSGKKSSLLSEYLLNRAVYEKKKGGLLPKEMEEWTFPLFYEKNKWGAPYFPGHPLYFNWSHSGQYVALALSEHQVGVDIQKRKTYPFSIAEKYFPEKVVQVLKKKEGKIQEKEFFRFWTLLEAWLKAKGTGFYEFSFPDVSDVLTKEGSLKQEGILLEKKKKWKYHFYEEIEGYEMCLVEKIEN